MLSVRQKSHAAHRAGMADQRDNLLAALCVPKYNAVIVASGYNARSVWRNVNGIQRAGTFRKRLNDAVHLKLFGSFNRLLRLPLNFVIFQRKLQALQRRGFVPAFEMHLTRQQPYPSVAGMVLRACAEPAQQLNVVNCASAPKTHG
ncbi:hypothetical protein SDC9_69022 [bioreactor metagenome]|uniref:Uncharacterized protein n=1 Tax=bioreactor metagenome TaxID=1076179 RepID=A0A644Y209_9ZZZZ